MEWSYFDYDFVALRIANELLESWTYKIGCFEVPLDGTSNTFFDSKYVVTNVSVPSSMLNKHHNDTC